MNPHIYIKVCEGINNDGSVHSIKLGNGAPFRSLTYPPQNKGDAARCSPNFYATGHKLPIRTQEQILVDSGYPETNKMPPNFWGLRPPHA